MSLFHPPADPATLLHRSSSVPFLDAKKIAAAFFSLQNQQQQQQQLLTPPASPLPVSFSPFDEVPNEILDQIIGLVHDDNDRPIYDVLRTISACSLVSRQFHAVANNWLYRYVPISDPYKFTKVFIPASRLAC
jgi:F-box-like